MCLCLLLLITISFVLGVVMIKACFALWLGTPAILKSYIQPTHIEKDNNFPFNLTFTLVFLKGLKSGHRYGRE